MMTPRLFFVLVLILFSYTTDGHDTEEWAEANRTHSPIHYIYNHGTKELTSTTEEGQAQGGNVTERENRILMMMKALVEKTILANETSRSTNNSRMMQWDEKLWPRTLPFKNETKAKPEAGICGWKVVAKATSHIQKIKIKKITKVANVSVAENRREVICCEGFLPDANASKCIPQCPGGCMGGTCLAPGRCRCPKDTVLSLAGTCTPTCPVSCLNGICIDDLCFCNAGHVIDISGHFCVPDCGGENSCKMGNCSAPGVCDCPAGYHLEGMESLECRPTCPGGCLNGLCVAPSDCHCLPGFHQHLHNACRRHCTPAVCGRHGHCADLFHCRCHPGWRVNPETGSCDLQDDSLITHNQNNLKN